MPTAAFKGALHIIPQWCRCLSMLDLLLNKHLNISQANIPANIF